MRVAMRAQVYFDACFGARGRGPRGGAKPRIIFPHPVALFFCEERDEKPRASKHGLRRADRATVRGRMRMWRALSQYFKKGHFGFYFFCGGGGGLPPLLHFHPTHIPPHAHTSSSISYRCHSTRICVRAESIRMRQRWYYYFISFLSLTTYLTVNQRPPPPLLSLTPPTSP